MNQERLAQLWTEILTEIGEDPTRTGLKDTPKRIAKMYVELFRGYDLKQIPNVTTFPNGEDDITYNQLIVDEGTFYSQCEHHGVPFFGKYWFAYLPNKKGKILGLSKVARIVDFYSSKLQVQERLTQEIVNELWKALIHNGVDPEGMALVMKGKHLCKSMRGVKKEGYMTTIELRGALKNNPETRAEFLKFVNGGN